MRKYNLYIAMLLSVLLCGCKSKPNESGAGAHPIRVTSDSVPDSVTVLIDINTATPLAERFKNSATIEFEEDVENFIGMPHNLVVRGDTLYLIDSYKAPGFYAYDRTGHQLFSYCAVGDGPEEFYDLSDFRVDDVSISAFDRTNGRIIFLDKNGRFAQTLDIPSHVYGAMIDRAGDYWIDFSNQETDGCKLAWRPDSIFNLSPVLPVPEMLKGMFNIPLQQFHGLINGETIYLPSLEHKIYTLRSGMAKLRYELDFNGLWPSDEDMGKWQGSKWAIKMRDFPVTRLTCQENDRWLVLGFYHDGKLYIHTFDKNTSTGSTYISNDDSYYTPLDVYNNELFMLKVDGNLDVLILE